MHALQLQLFIIFLTVPHENQFWYHAISLPFNRLRRVVEFTIARWNKQLTSVPFNWNPRLCHNVALSRGLVRHFQQITMFGDIFLYGVADPLSASTTNCDIANHEALIHCTFRRMLLWEYPDYSLTLDRVLVNRQIVTSKIIENIRPDCPLKHKSS